MSTELPPPPAPAADAAPPRRRRRWPVRLAWALGALVLLLALVLGAGWQALRTDAGTAWLLSQVSGLRITGGHGTLQGGPYAAARVEFGLEGSPVRVAIDGLAWRDLRWRWRPHAGAWTALEIDGLRAQRIEVHTRPSTTPPTHQPPPDLQLPIELLLRDAQVQALQVNTLPPLRTLALDLHLGAEQGRLHRIERLAFGWDRLQLQAHGEVQAVGPMAVSAQAQLHSQPLAGASGALGAAWQAALQAGGTLPQLVFDARLRPAAGEPIAASLDLHSVVAPFAAWPLAELRASTAGLDLATLASTLPTTRLEGHAVLQSSGLDRPAQADIQLRNGLPGRWDESRLPVRELRLDLRGRPDDARRLDLHAFELLLGTAQQPAGRVSGSGRWAGDALTLHTTVADLQPARLDGRLAAMVLGGPVDVSLRGLAPAPAASAPAHPPAAASAAAAAPAAPAASASDSASTHWQAALTARLEGRLQQPAGLPVRLSLDGAAAATAQGLQLELHQLQATAGAARAQAEASAQQHADGRWQIASRGALSDFDPVPWWPGPEGSAWRQGPHRLNGRWEADLSLAAAPAAAASAPAAPAAPSALQRLRGRVQLQLADSRLAGVPLQGQLTVRAEGAAPLATLAAELQAAGNRVQADGQFMLAGDGSADRWQLSAEADTLAALAPLVRLVPGAAAWQPAGGRLRLKAEAQGRWPSLRSHGEAHLAGLRAGSLSVGAADARWRFGGGLDAPLELVASADALALQGQRSERVRAELSGSARQHRLQLEADSNLRPPTWAEPPPAPAKAGRAGLAATPAPAATPTPPTAAPPASAPAGAVTRSAGDTGTQLRLRLDGAWQPGTDGARWQGRVAQLRAGSPVAAEGGWLVADGLQGELSFDRALGLRQAAAQPGQLQLLGATLRWSALRWQAGAGGAAPRIEVQAQLDPLPVAPLLKRVQPEFGWGGDLVVAGRASVTTGSGGFRADVVVERRGGDLGVTDEGGTQALGLTDLRLALDAHDGVWHFTQAVAGRTVGVLAGAQSLRVAPDAVWPAPDTPLEGVLELRVDNLGVWGPWTPAGWRLTGQLHTSATLGGRFGAPEYTGRIEGSGVGARNLLLGVNVTDGDVVVALKGPTAQIERFTLKGGSGRLRLTGGASFGEAPRAQLQLNANNFQLLGRVDRRIVTSGQAELALEPETIRVDGRFVVDEGLIDFSRSDAPTLDDDVTVVRADADGAADTPAASPKPPRAVQARLSIDLGDRLHIRGRGLDAFLRGELRMTTPNGRLAVNGTVRTENGTYAAYGQKLQIERGLVDFIGPLENPRLDILALRPNLETRVGVSIGGTALNPRVRLYSEPEMSDTDKLSWLVLGRAPEGLGRADTALLQHAAMALLSGEGESTTDKVMRALGLDEFQVRQEGGDGDVRNTVVTLGKQISRRWYLGYERGVNATAGSWQAIYRIAQRFTLRAQAGEDNAVDIIWTWRWD